MVEQIFLSTQVPQSVIISNKLAYTSCMTSFPTTKDLESSSWNKKSANTRKSVLKNRY